MTRHFVLILILGIGLTLASGATSAETATDVNCVQCVNTRDLAQMSVTKAKVAEDSIVSAKIVDGSIKGRDLAAASVTRTKIANGTVDWKKLATSLQEKINEMEARLAALEDLTEASTVLELDGYLALDDSDPARPAALFSGINVQIVNGAGSDVLEPNGLGNLIVGYDIPYTPREEDDYVCSSGYFQTKEECEAAGWVWAQQHKSGSHNVIIGPEHRYSWMNGIAVGRNNTINNFGASVIGAQGGYATGQYAIVVGGGGNRATGTSSAVLGGWNNWATNRAARISGGVHGRATGQVSSITAGGENVASGDHSAVTGGTGNEAVGSASTVSGGHGRKAPDTYDWVAGTLFEDE